MQIATFTANVSALPFPDGTAFSDPGGSNSVNVYLKNDFGPYPAGTLAGVSFDRFVTINSVVPKPSSITLLGIGVVGLCCHLRRARVNSSRI
jgi:hypothetical protein